MWLSWHSYQIHKKNTDNLPEKGNDAGFRVLLLICFIFISVHVYISMGLCAICVHPPMSPKRVSDSMEPELQTVGTCLVWVLGHLKE